jgi:hypothetical protein
VEIACPPDCGYLTSARQHPPAAVQRRQEREARFLASVVQGFGEGQYQLFLFLQMTVARCAPQALPALLDRDVADAARALAQTAETAARGIIYEHQTGSLPAQRLAAELKKAIEMLHQGGRAPRQRDLTLALRATERAAAGAAAALGSGDRAYLELVESLFRPVAASAAGDGTPHTPLIVP